ncbi:MAG: helix-turn-helix domain-containing protein [Candidatus Sumerlaeota bacterium]|nr:helix-turn-helix domain-containing protein [Candidatus Sumerlaeota bacterium]
MLSDVLLTSAELAKALKVKPQTVLRFVKNKDIPAIRIGHQWRFSSARVMEWLAKNAVNVDEKSA